MEVTLHNTDKIVTLNGMPCRIWEGTTQDGIKLHAYIVRVAAKEGQDLTRFERELQETSKPSTEVEAIPLRMVL